MFACWAPVFLATFCSCDIPRLSSHSDMILLFGCQQWCMWMHHLMPNYFMHAILYIINIKEAMAHICVIMPVGTLPWGQIKRKKLINWGQINGRLLHLFHASLSSVAICSAVPWHSMTDIQCRPLKHVQQESQWSMVYIILQYNHKPVFFKLAYSQEQHCTLTNVVSELHNYVVRWCSDGHMVTAWVVLGYCS